MRLSVKKKSAFKFFEGGRTILQKEDMKRIGKEAILLISDRVKTQGTDRRGSRMTPYSKGYAKSKGKAGYITSHRDLLRTGRLWRSFKVIRASKKKVLVGWTDARSVTIVEAESQRNEFLGLAPRDEKGLAELIQDVVGRRVEKLRFVKKR